MRKSTIIATCLLNSSMVNRLEEGEASVRQIFLNERPSADYRLWNSEINDDAAKDIIKTVGRASRINVAKFINDLGD